MIISGAGVHTSQISLQLPWQGTYHCQQKNGQLLAHRCTGRLLQHKNEQKTIGPPL